jgi:Domain of unknown function (DUF4384)
VYCYLMDEDKKIQRFFPNRFAKDSLVNAQAPLELPGKMKFQIVANEKQVKEAIGCFATERDVMNDLPGFATGTDFEPLQVVSMEELRNAFASAAKGALGEDYFYVDF